MPTKSRGIDVEAKVKAAVAKLWTLSTEFEKATPAELKELLRRMVREGRFVVRESDHGPTHGVPLHEGR